MNIHVTCVTCKNPKWQEADQLTIYKHSQDELGAQGAYERSVDACHTFGMKPQKESDLDMAQAFFDP